MWGRTLGLLWNLSTQVFLSGFYKPLSRMRSEIFTVCGCLWLEQASPPPGSTGLKARKGCMWPPPVLSSLVPTWFPLRKALCVLYAGSPVCHTHLHIYPSLGHPMSPMTNSHIKIKVQQPSKASSMLPRLPHRLILFHCSPVVRHRGTCQAIILPPSKPLPSLPSHPEGDAMSMGPFWNSCLRSASRALMQASQGTLDWLRDTSY